MIFISELLYIAGISWTLSSCVLCKRSRRTLEDMRCSWWSSFFLIPRKWDLKLLYHFHVGWFLTQRLLIKLKINGRVDNCLSLFGLLQQNTIDWGAYKQQKFSQFWTLGSSRSGTNIVWWGPASWFIAIAFSLCPHVADRLRISWGLL